MRFVLVTGPGLELTEALFADACRARGLAFSAVVPGDAAGSGLRRPDEWRLLYRAAVDRGAELLEKLLHGPRTVALHDPHFTCDHPPLRLMQCGLAVPRAVYVPAARTERLAGQVEWLGGWPVVLKRAGLEGGRGVTLLHDLASLEAALVEPGGEARLERYLPHRRCWRVVVLDGQVLARLACVAPEGDFRTNAVGFGVEPAAAPPGGLDDVACRAVAALRLRFGGVDVIEASAGGLVVSEVNFPCSFVHVQGWTGVDIAGAMVDHLRQRAG